jgi:tetrahydromethanopterin S-methyltransferase subunit E
MVNMLTNLLAGIVVMSGGVLNVLADLRADTSGGKLALHVGMVVVGVLFLAQAYKLWKREDQGQE